jgi:hypothetical protein
MNLSHLSFPDKGWGYLPATEEVFEAFRFCQKLYKPQSVLEIGFHIGHSTTYQLEIYTEAKIVGVSPDNERVGKEDDRIDPEVRRNMAETLKVKYLNRFQWLQGRTAHVRDKLQDYVFDFALVDGNHHEMAVLLDLTVCAELDIKQMLIDNWDQKQIQEAVETNGKYELVKVFPYKQTFKNKTKQNELALVKMRKK